MRHLANSSNARRLFKKGFFLLISYGKIRGSLRPDPRISLDDLRHCGPSSVVTVPYRNATLILSLDPDSPSSFVRGSTHHTGGDMGQEVRCSSPAALLGLRAISSGFHPSSSYAVTARHKHSVVDRQYVTFCASFASGEHTFLFLDHPVSVARECEEVTASALGRCASAGLLVPPSRRVLLNELAVGSVRPLGPEAAHAVKMRGDACLTGRGAIRGPAPQRRRRVLGACSSSCHGQCPNGRPLRAGARCRVSSAQDT